MKRIYDIKRLESYMNCVQGLAKLSISVYDSQYRLIAAAYSDAQEAAEEEHDRIIEFLKNSKSSHKFNMRLWRKHEAAAAKAVYMKNELVGFIFLDHFRHSDRADPYCDKFQDGLIICNATRIRSVMTLTEIGMLQFAQETKTNIKPKRKKYGADIENYIADHLADKLTLQVLCDEFNLTQGQLNRIFKEELHLSFQSFVRNARLAEAQKLLRQTDRPVSEIAKQVGCGGHTLFDKFFKKHVGCTPTEYREREQ